MYLREFLLKFNHPITQYNTRFYRNEGPKVKDPSDSPSPCPRQTASRRHAQSQLLVSGGGLRPSAPVKCHFSNLVSCGLQQSGWSIARLISSLEVSPLSLIKQLSNCFLWTTNNNNNYRYSPQQVCNNLARTKVRCVCCVVSFPIFHYSDLLPITCWQLGRLRGSCRETCVMEFGHLCVV